MKSEKQLDELETSFKPLWNPRTCPYCGKQLKEVVDKRLGVKTGYEFACDCKDWTKGLSISIG